MFISGVSVSSRIYDLCSCFSRVNSVVVKRRNYSIGLCMVLCVIVSYFCVGFVKMLFVLWICWVVVICVVFSFCLWVILGGNWFVGVLCLFIWYLWFW